MRARHCLVSSPAGSSQMPDELASQGLCRLPPLCFAWCIACSLALHADAGLKLHDRAVAWPSAMLCKRLEDAQTAVRRHAASSRAAPLPPGQAVLHVLLQEKEGRRCFSMLSRMTSTGHASACRSAAHTRDSKGGDS